MEMHRSQHSRHYKSSNLTSSSTNLVRLLSLQLVLPKLSRTWERANYDYRRADRIDHHLLLIVRRLSRAENGASHWTLVREPLAHLFDCHFPRLTSERNTHGQLPQAVPRSVLLPDSGRPQSNQVCFESSPSCHFTKFNVLMRRCLARLQVGHVRTPQDE